MKKDLIFKPRARLILQLGDQLIKNESIAFLELVKNAYDADATRVSIVMEKVDDPENGKIIIEDDGCGMTPEIITNVWMEPGSDFKEKMFRENIRTPKFKRLPLGEKGIGRFAVHKLGNLIEVITRAENNPEVVLSIDWSLFNKSDYLEKAWSGKNLKEQNTQKILKNALFTFNGIFNDIFEGLIQNEKYSAYQGTFSSNNINEKNKGRINIKLLLDFSDMEKFYPGNVYRINKNAKNSSELLKDILDIKDENLFNKINNKIKKKSIQVFAEVTPLCDFLQGKIKLYRVIEGFIIPEKYKDEQNIYHDVKIKKAEFIYKTPVFTYKNKIYRLILDFKYFSSKTEDELKNFSPIFRLRKELLNDIQIKLSSNINRTGILFID